MRRNRDCWKVAVRKKLTREAKKEKRLPSLPKAWCKHLKFDKEMKEWVILQDNTYYPLYDSWTYCPYCGKKRPK